MSRDNPCLCWKEITSSLIRNAMKCSKNTQLLRYQQLGNCVFQPGMNDQILHPNYHTQVQLTKPKKIFSEIILNHDFQPKEIKNIHVFKSIFKKYFFYILWCYSDVNYFLMYSEIIDQRCILFFCLCVSLSCLLTLIIAFELVMIETSYFKWTERSR